MALLALVLAFLTYRYVENPVRLFRPWKFATNNGTLWIAGALITCSLLCIALMMIIRSLTPESLLSKQIDHVYKDLNPLRDQCTRDAFKNLETADNPLCITGNKASSSTIVIWGDSHSDHWMPVLQSFFQRNRVIQYSMAGCPPFLVSAHTDANNCYWFNEQVAQSLLKIKTQGATGLVIAARWTAYAGMPAIQRSQMGSQPPYFEEGITNPKLALQSLAVLLNRTLTLADKSDIPILIRVLGSKHVLNTC